MSYARELQSLSPRSQTPTFIGDLGRVVRMEVVWVGRRPEGALSTLEGAGFWARLDFPPRFSLPGAVERFARAELLHQLGRREEAARWYQPNPDGFVYAGGPSALRLAQLHDRWAKPHRRRNTMRASFDGSRTATQNCRPW